MSCKKKEEEEEEEDENLVSAIRVHAYSKTQNKSFFYFVLVFP